ncbi:MAG: hypothetical protein FWD90_11700 [Defluviitaleaceae bacterium]|nr:hypothetical protein [Defluviitaleaceae bacterium]
MLTFMVIIPVLLAVLLFAFSSNRIAKAAAVFIQAALFVVSVYLVLITRGAEVTTVVGSYDGILGIILRANSLSAVFVLITAFIFLAVSVYSFTYRERKDARTFWFLMFLLEASFIGLFLSGDLFNVFVLLEVSTLVLVILAMYDRKNRSIFHGKVYLLANVVAIQFYLLGLGYLYRITGALDMERVGESLGAMDGQNLILPYALIMTGIAFKSTLIPFLSWTPKVRLYENAPTVVAAVMSGLQAKAALYLFMRFQEMFAPVAAQQFFLIIGIIAGLFGAVMAICQTNIKMILAYHTISQIGLITVGISHGGEHAYIGGLYHAVGHAVFKTALFLCAGIISHSYGTADVHAIRGVMKRMPAVGIAALAAVLGITGAPLFIGSVSKYFIFYYVDSFTKVIVILLGLGTIISFVKFSSVFFGRSDLAGDAFKADKCKMIPVVLMGALCFAGGVFGTRFIYFLFRFPAAVDFWAYVQDAGIVIASMAGGYFIYKYLISGRAILNRIEKINFSFKQICASIGIFLAIMLVMIGYF